MRQFSFGLLIFSVLAFNAYADVFLGTAGNFAVLGATPKVTNTGATTLTGLLGVSPAAMITGLNTVTVNGTNGATIGNPNVHLGDAVATTAQTDASKAFVTLAGLVSPPGNNLTGMDLGGLDLGAGVYKFDSSAQLTNNLILDFGSASTLNQNIVFQIGTTLTTASGSSVTILNANSTDNVYWQVGSSATLGTTTSFLGNIIANVQVAMQTGATDLCGSVIALTAEVTLDHNTIANTCTAATVGGGQVIGGGMGGGPGVPVPEGGSTLLYLCSFLMPIGAMAFRRRRSI